MAVTVVERPDRADERWQTALSLLIQSARARLVQESR